MSAMKNFLFILFLIIFLAIGNDAFSARPHHMPITRHAEGESKTTQPAQDNLPVKEIHNSFFSVTLPDGWRAQKTGNVAPTGANVVFKKGKKTAITLTMTKMGLNNKQVAEKTAEKMRKRGMEVSSPVENNGLYTIDISKKGVKGKAWFGKNGDITAITVIIAPELDEANELLRAIKPIAPGLVPAPVE